MNDFTYCSNEKCNKRAECRRSIPSDDPWQSNAYFKQLPGDRDCFGFIPNRNARRKMIEEAA